MPKQFDLFTLAPVVKTGRKTIKTTPKEETNTMTKTKTTPPKSSHNTVPAAKPAAAKPAAAKPAAAKPAAAKPAAAKPAPAIPTKSWEAFKIEADAKLTAAATSAVFRPKTTKGLIKVHALGLWIKPSEIVAYHAARRNVAIMRADYLKRYYQTAFEAEIRAAGGDEAAALSALGINYHDDRGDGLLYVTRMQPKHLTAWVAAAAAAGVKSSRVRAA